jgi:alpha-beta hydrolase superfamily lysophospholipase
MPYFNGATGRVYYRRWNPPSCDAVVIFLHGYGEHSGFYHRLGNTLNHANIELVALDEIGHGLSEGDRGVVNSFDDLVENGRRLTQLATDASPGVPIFLMGHSMGAIAAALTIMDDPRPYHGAILTGSLLSPVRWVLDLIEAGEQATFEIEFTDLSSDPAYLDEIANDALASSTTLALSLLAPIIPPAWELLDQGFAKTELPMLFIQGELDILGPVDEARRWVARLPNAQIKVFEEKHHDILNETVHREVADEIIAFIQLHL